MSNSIVNELLKIPPVTRFLCASSLAVTIPVLLQLVSPYKVIFVRDFVFRRFELWRIFTSFFLGSSGINYVFDLVMLYRNSDALESTHYIRRSSDYAWQLTLACLGILTLNIPLKSFVHYRALMHTLTYVMASLSPPGAMTSVMGLISIPVAYFPYAMLAMDLLMGGPPAAAQAISGMVVGHLWWWGIWGGGTGAGGAEQGPLAAFATAPRWLKDLFGERGVTRRESAREGVRVYAPRPTAQASTGTATGYRWGSGNRLGG